MASSVLSREEPDELAREPAPSLFVDAVTLPKPTARDVPAATPHDPKMRLERGDRAARTASNVGAGW
jgi:hypothetical protein